MSITIEEVAALLGRLPGEIVDAFNAVDQSAISLAAEAQFVGYVWNKTSPIFGDPASVWLERPDVTEDGAVYVLEDTVNGGGCFQPSDPDTGGDPMTPERAQQLVDELRDSQIRRTVLETVVELVSQQLPPQDEP